MLEASGRAVSLAFRQFELGGLDHQRLVASSSLTNVGSGGFADWNDLVGVFEQAEELAGGNWRLADVCHSSVVRALPEGQALMALARDVAEGTQLINMFADATFFANVRYPRMRRIGEHRLSVTLKIPERRGFKDSPAFFRAMAGVFRSSPGFAGLPSASVEAKIRPFAADYQLVLPPSPSIDSKRLSPAERAVRSQFVRYCEDGLRETRRLLQAQRDAELRAREGEAFQVLSGAVSRALAQAERSTMPLAAVEAIRDSLGCRRVVVRRVDARCSKPTTLAAVGPPLARLSSVEAQVAEGLLIVSADIAKPATELRLLRQLVPWLALIFCPPAGAAPQPTPVNPGWNDARLADLAAEWRLSPRQEQVLWLLAQGESNRRIAQILNCAEGTAELHVHAVLKKSGLFGRAAVASYFFSGK